MHAFDPEDEFTQAAERTEKQGLGHLVHVVSDPEPKLAAAPAYNSEPVRGIIGFPKWKDGVVSEVDHLRNPYPHIAFGPNH